MPVNAGGRIRKRRRILFGTGATALLLNAIAAVSLGAGCIFDEGGYQGGGRRTGSPTAEPTATATATATTTSTSTATSTSTSQPSDAGDAEGG